jgi:hypothetical protein
MFINDAWASLPGIQAQQATWENAFCWGREGLRMFTNGYISPNAIDSGNTPTYEIRPGLVLGKITSSGQWTNYSATATDGSQVAAAVFMMAVRMQNLAGINQAAFIGIMVGGPIKAANLYGFDQQARQQMRGMFAFDDDFTGQQWYPFKTEVTQTANYTILPSDNNTLFDNTGAVGEVDFTLPPILPGYFFGFQCNAAQTLKVISNEGGNIIGLNTLTANSVAFTTGGQQIGASFVIFSNPAGTKWLVNNTAAATAAVTNG